MSWFVMEDGFSYGKVEDSYTYPTGKEHSEIGDVGELWLVVIPAELLAWSIWKTGSSRRRAGPHLSLLKFYSNKKHGLSFIFVWL